MISERIRTIRKEKGLTQKALGEICGIAEPTIRKYELGKLHPKYETIQRIAEGLNVPVSKLMGWDDLDKKAPEHLAEEVAILDLASRIGGLTKDSVLLFAQLNDAGQAKAIAYLQDLLKIEAYCVPENEK